jgi:hypothetical protein
MMGVSEHRGHGPWLAQATPQGTVGASRLFTRGCKIALSNGTPEFAPGVPSLLCNIAGKNDIKMKPSESAVAGWRCATRAPHHGLPARFETLTAWTPAE